MYRVLKRFNDRFNGKRYNPGDPYEPDQGRDAVGRIDHLIARGFLQEIPEAPSAGLSSEGRPDREDDACAPHDLIDG